MTRTHDHNGRATSAATAVLTLVSSLATLLGLEMAFRVGAHLQNQGILARVGPEVDIPIDGPASLGHLIRRSDNPQIVYELKPGISALYQGARVEVNADGFRGPLVDRRTRPGTSRIVGIGDSFMFGQGVGDAEPYLAVLQRLLDETMPGRRVEIVNTAVPGYNTVMEVATLEAKGLAYRPDLVIIEFVGNDLSLPNFVREELPVVSLRRSFLVEFVRERLSRESPAGVLERLAAGGLLGIVNNAPGTLGVETDPARVPDAYRHLVGWGAYRAAMGRLRGLSEEHSFEVVSIALAPDGGAQKLEALRVSAEMGFHVLDVGEVLASYLREHGEPRYLGSPLALSEVDGHPTALGHELAARAILAFLAEERLLAGMR